MSENSLLEIQAAVTREDDQFGLEKLRVGSLGPYDVLVKIAGTGVCHSDIAASSAAGKDLRPIVLGHEGAGIVEAVGARVEKVAAGDSVLISYDHCGHCRNCLSGKPYFCRHLMDLNGGIGAPTLREHAELTDSSGNVVHNTFMGQSSFGEYSVASETNVVKVSSDLPLEILGPLGCGFQTGAGAVINVLDLRPGQSIVVFGTGAVGLAGIMAAKICRAGAVIAVDVVPERLETASSLGATHTIDGKSPDVLDQIKKIAGGVDCTLETSGRPDVISNAIGALDLGGRCGLAAPGGEVPIDLASITLTGRRVLGFISGNAIPSLFLPQLIEWWQAGLFPFDTLVKQFPLSDISEAVSAASSGRIIKPVLIP